MFDNFEFDYQKLPKYILIAAIVLIFSLFVIIFLLTLRQLTTMP